MLYQSCGSIVRKIGKSSNTIHQYLSRRGIPITQNERRITALKNVHKGRRAFIVGMGPSLRIEDLDQLAGEISFACNKVYLAFDQTNWRPTYYSIVDVLVAANNVDKIRQLKLTKIFQECVRKYFVGFDDILWVKGRNSPVKNGDLEFRFSLNLLEGYYPGWSVIYDQLQLAIYMGIREIYLIGVDFSFEVPDKTGEVCEHGEVLKHQGEVNHFHRDYRVPGETWTMPRLDMQYEAFACAKEVMSDLNGVIYNASRQTKLDVFPCVNFEDLFAN